MNATSAGATIGVKLSEIQPGPKGFRVVVPGIVVKAWRGFRHRVGHRTAVSSGHAHATVPTMKWSEAETDETIRQRAMSVASGWMFTPPYN